MRYLYNKNTDPYYNLALEEWIFENKTDDDYFMVWQNDKSIIIGRNQNTIEEIDQSYIIENNIKAVRRMTGGGAVYHDLGNLNLSFFTNVDDNFEIDFKDTSNFLIRSLKNMGIDAYSSGRNDILVNNKKISGLSQRINGKRILTNACILFDVDLDNLSKALKVNEAKFKSKGVKSIKSRVANIKNELDFNMDIEEFISKLTNAILSFYPSSEIFKLSHDENNQVLSLRNNKYITYEWNYGQSIGTNINNHKYIPDKGLLEIRATVDKGLIENIKIYGDFFATKDIAELENMFIGKRYIPSEIILIANEINIKDYIGPIDFDDLMDLLFG